MRANYRKFCLKKWLSNCQYKNKGWACCLVLWKSRKKSVSDSAGLLKYLLIGIENLGDNMENIRKEMDYWRNPKVMEAEKNLERLHDKVPLSEPARKGPENAAVISPEIQSPFPAQRQNIFPIGGLEGIPATSTAQESSEGPPISEVMEQVSALRKP